MGTIDNHQNALLCSNLIHTRQTLGFSIIIIIISIFIFLVDIKRPSLTTIGQPADDKETDFLTVPLFNHLCSCKKVKYFSCESNRDTRIITQRCKAFLLLPLCITNTSSTVGFLVFIEKLLEMNLWWVRFSLSYVQVHIWFMVWLHCLCYYVY